MEVYHLSNILPGGIRAIEPCAMMIGNLNEERERLGRNRHAFIENTLAAAPASTPGDAARHAAPVVYLPSPRLCHQQHRLAFRAALLSRPAPTVAPTLAGGHRIGRHCAFHVNSGLRRTWPGHPRPGATPG